MYFREFDGITDVTILDVAMRLGIISSCERGVNLEMFKADVQMASNQEKMSLDMRI